MGAEGKPLLDVVLGRDLDRRGERVPLLPKHVPPAQRIPVVGQLHVVGGGDVDDNDVTARRAQHHIPRNIVDVTAFA